MVRVDAGGRSLRLRELQVHVVATVRAGRDPGDGGQRQHLRPALLGEVEVVLHEGVLGVVLAAHHAVAARDAGVAVRSDPAEEGVGHLLAARGLGLTEEDADRCRVEGVAHPELVGDLLHHVVRRRAQWVLDHAQHPLRLVVVRRQLGLPVGDVSPLGVLVERVEGFVERVGVDERAAADAGPRHDQRVTDGLDALDAVHPERRVEQEPLQVHRGLGVVVVVEPRPCLDHRDPVALLDQTQRADRAAEARADDDHVVVVGRGRAVPVGRVRGHHARPSFFITRRLTVITLAYVSSDIPRTGANRSSLCTATDCVSV